MSSYSRKKKKSYRGRAKKNAPMGTVKTLGQLYPGRGVKYKNPYFVKHDMDTKIKNAVKSKENEKRTTNL